MAAAVHASNVGRRAAAGDRKVVFKSVLDNPFKVTWFATAFILLKKQSNTT